MKMEADERKKQIRQAAIKVFLDKGFRNTVMNDIMEATGLSRGGLYHHFKKMQSILDKICKAYYTKNVKWTLQRRKNEKYYFPIKKRKQNYSGRIG